MKCETRDVVCCLWRKKGVWGLWALVDWMCFVLQIYIQELSKQREMLYTVELVCLIPNQSTKKNKIYLTVLTQRVVVSFH